jgi:AcrR family transcriptional regulator
VQAVTRALQSEQTQQRIVTAAARLFARKGYSATSIADIAGAVRVTKGALYHHFAGKEAIFYAVVEAIRKTWQDVVARAVVHNRDAIGRLEALLENQGRFLQENESFCLVLNGLMMEGEGVGKDLLEAVQAVYAELARFIEQILRKGQAAGQIRQDVDAKLAALTMVGTIRGTGCARPVSERMKVSYTSMMETVKLVLVKGLKA